MPTPRSTRGVPISGRARLGAINQRDAQQDRATGAAKVLVSDAKRGTQMASAVDLHVQGLGASQLRSVIHALFHALAESYSNTKESDRA
ncbi:hypothetical protein [Mycolicibacterium hippocampi]|uniref:Uncharacterized protein n=1 Tax=Mycolicibacterium hippocampi TaxID=659824 RepID=A0A7I9ZW97_9MYCO|nr:hypothetical protein [Mycolicibacterium hippocampi]GFH05037.1 hypothetical protein MHIP_55200 [Mycolicibacterium hippocampi]